MAETKFVCKVIKHRFISEDYKIYLVSVDSNIYGNVKTNKNNECVICGNFQTLVPNNVYNVVGELEHHKT